MKNKIFTKKLKSLRAKMIAGVAIVGMAMSFSNQSFAQITITTESGTNFTGGNGVGGNSAITFAIENTNTSAIIIDQIDNFWQTANTGTTPSLWYTSTQLSGAPTIAAPDWTLITGPVGAITVAANGYYPTFTGLGFQIPPATTYRFAIQSTAGIRYSGATPVPSPTTLSASGVNLYVYDYSINAASVGYGGAFPSPANNPRAFTGRIIFNPAIACVGAPNAGNTAASDSTVCSGVNFNLSLQGATVGTGLSYQWESSTDNINWSPIAGATSSSFNTTQSVTTYYHCVVTCTGQSSTSTSLMVTSNTLLSCYCASGATGTAGADIGNVTIATLNNGVGTPATNNPSSVNLYTDFSALPATALTQGITYPISITQINSAATTTTSYTTVYIDYNHNGIFEAIDETYAIGQTSTANGNVVGGNIYVPFTSLTGITKMRVVLRTGGTAAQSACGTFAAGETEDYLVDIVAGVACTAPPVAGTTVASITAGCPGTAVSLSLNGNSNGSGQIFQWQSSPDNATWTNISGANAMTYNFQISSTAYYQCLMTCSGQSSASASVLVTQNNPLQCYCSTGLGGGNCSTANLITAVEIVGTSLNTTLVDTCSSGTGGTLTTYSPSGSTTAILTRGSSYTLNVTSSGNSVISVWIDYDQDGIFGINEWKRVCLTSVANAVNSITLDIPWGILGGQTGMRIRSRANGSPNDSTSACTNFASGEAEDFLITIDIGNEVKALENATKVSVNPNPTKDFVTVSFTTPASKNSQIKMVNTRGQVVYEEKLASIEGKFKRTIDVRDFAKGIYFLQYQSESGLTTTKVVVE